MKFDSLAMIETNGLVSSLVAINKMLSLGNVEFLKKEVIPNGQVTLFIIGNSSEIKQVLNAGIIAAQKVGVVISSGIVPYPNEVIEKIIFESTTSINKPKKVKKSIKKEEEKSESLFDQYDEEKSFIDLMAEVADNSPDIAGEVLLVKHHEQNTGIIEDNTFNVIPSSDDVEKELDYPAISSKQTSEQNGEILEDENKLVNSNKEIKDSSKVDITENENESEIIEIEVKSSKNDDSSEETREENLEFEGMSHLERLRAEAKLEIQSENDVEQNISKLDEIEPPTIEVKNKKISSDEFSEVKRDDKENIESELDKMNVPDLRKLARSKENFPIKGREISKANRKVLLEYFKQL